MNVPPTPKGPRGARVADRKTTSTAGKGRGNVVFLKDPISDPPPPASTATLGDLYSAAVKARLGAPDLPQLEEQPAATPPGEMVLWLLGGWLCDPSMGRALEGLREALLAVTERQDFGSDASREELHALAIRVQVIATIHAAALSASAPATKKKLHG